MGAPDQKVCRGCGALKAIDDFPASPRTKDGHMHKCRDCLRKSQRGATFVTKGKGKTPLARRINSLGKTVAGVAREFSISENRLQRALAGKATLEMREAVRLYVAIGGREKLEGLR